jgi:hypothetical protein
MSSIDETRAEESPGDKLEGTSRSEAPNDDDQLLSGLEINLGDFTRTQGLMKSLRLMLNNQIVVQLEDVASGVSDAGRKFKMGDIEQANLDVARAYAAFGQRTNQWENQARNLEQQMKTQAAKNPKSISIDAMNRMKSEQSAVRTRIRTAEVQFRRLHQGLDQAFTNLQNRPIPADATPSAATPGDVPAEFLKRFKGASSEERPAIVKDFYEVEAVLKVTVSRGTTAGYDIKFEPMPPLARLYFLTMKARIVRLKQLGEVVVVQDLAAGEEREMKLVEFVKQVQGGVWLVAVRN